MDTSGNGCNTMPIPIIDISDPSQNVGAALVEAAARYGFIYIRGRGLEIDGPTIDQTFEISREFFKSPQTQKMECAIGADNRGWSGMHVETLDPQHQKVEVDSERPITPPAFNFGEFVDGKAQQPLPKSLVPHEAELNDFATLCQRLCIKLLRLFALGLQIDPKEGGEDWFSSRHDPSKGPSGSVLRLLYYPAWRAPTSSLDSATDIRAGAHSDYGSVTLLFQRPNQPGLEILTPRSIWSPVAISPPGTEEDAFPPILINIGDLLSYWTKGLLKSTIHRVIVPDGQDGNDRYSIAYFCHPISVTELLPVPSELVKSRVSGEEEVAGKVEEKIVMTAKEHLHSRLAATYKLEK